MANGLYVSYCRVSTSAQGVSGLGLEAQQKAITDYLKGGSGKLVAEFVEIESGKKNDRPKLQEAVALCRRKRATLIIAKLDRLARNVAFISSLMESKVDFVAVDFPTANTLTLHILAAVAEYEGKMISARTKAGLEAAKARGQRLGPPKSNATPEGRLKGSARGGLSRQFEADAFAQGVTPIIHDYKKQGFNLSQIARQLNEDSEPTPRGKIGAWTAQGVKNVLLRGTI